MFELMPFLELRPSPFSVIGHGAWHLEMLLIQDPFHARLGAPFAEHRRAVTADGCLERPGA
jgi:hypothetical protein